MRPDDRDATAGTEISGGSFCSTQACTYFVPAKSEINPSKIFQPQDLFEQVLKSKVGCSLSPQLNYAELSFELIFKINLLATIKLISI